jgi:hypothetical protein
MSRLSPPLSARQPDVTGVRGVTPRGVAAPPGPLGAAGCRWLRRWGPIIVLVSRPVLLTRPSAVSNSSHSQKKDYLRRGSRCISAILPRFTHKKVWEIMQKWQAVSPSPSDRSLGVNAINPLVAFTTSMEEEGGAILLFCPGHHTRNYVQNKRKSAVFHFIASQAERAAIFLQLILYLNYLTI